jgi:hypothetical protein
MLECVSSESEWTFDQSAANGRKEPSLPNAVLQHFASAENLPYVDGPKPPLIGRSDAAPQLR